MREILFKAKRKDNDLQDFERAEIRCLQITLKNWEEDK